MDLDLDLPRHGSASALARQALRARLGDELPHAQLEEVLLVVTELVNNALKHGEGPIRLRMDYDGRVVRGEVVDDGAGFEAEVQHRGLDEVGGRGLAIVDRLAANWGVHEGTTHVWFEMHTHVWFEIAEDDGQPHLGAERRPDELD